MKNNKKGISLILLIITIIVMIVLASAVIIALNSSGIINKANNATNSVELASEMLAIEQAKAFAYKSSNGEKITVEQLQQAFNETVETGAVTVMDNVDTILLKFNESNRYYEIANTGKVEYIGNIKLKSLTVQSVDSTGKLLGENRYTVAAKKYSIVPAHVEDYECAVEKIEGIIEEDTTIQQLYYKIFDDDTELVFTGLDESKNITNDTANIVSYMIGDGTTTSGNGLLQKTIQGILKVPEIYSGKPVTHIGTASFANCRNITGVTFGENITTIQNAAFSECIGLGEIAIGKKVSNIEARAFRYCFNLNRVTIGKNVSTIGEGVFAGCNKLNTVTIESEHAGLIFNCFNGCSIFTEIKVNSDNKTYKVKDNVLYSKDGKILYLVPTGVTGELVIPDGVEIIYNRAVCAKTQISKVLISDTVTTIKGLAFADCSGLKEVIIGKNVSNIEDRGFTNCNNLKVVTIDSSVVASKITAQNSCERLVYGAQTIYIKVGITPGSYITNIDNFTQSTTDKAGYVKYVKNV